MQLPRKPLIQMPRCANLWEKQRTCWTRQSLSLDSTNMSTRMSITRATLVSRLRAGFAGCLEPSVAMYHYASPRHPAVLISVPDFVLCNTINTSNFQKFLHMGGSGGIVMYSTYEVD